MMTIVEYLDSKNRYSIKNRYAIDEPINNDFYDTFSVDNDATISAYIPPTTIHIKYDNNN